MCFGQVSFLPYIVCGECLVWLRMVVCPLAAPQFRLLLSASIIAHVDQLPHLWLYAWRCRSRLMDVILLQDRKRTVHPSWDHWARECRSMTRGQCNASIMVIFTSIQHCPCPLAGARFSSRRG